MLSIAYWMEELRRKVVTKCIYLKRCENKTENELTGISDK
jgi:hypothetical protein